MRAMNDLLLIHAGQLATLSGSLAPRPGREMTELGIIEDGAVLVRDGIIEKVGKTAKVAREADPSIRVVDALGQVVLPGFVDAHTHLVFAGNRALEYEMRILGATYQEIAASGGGIKATVRATRQASEDELVENALHWTELFLQHGTTTIEAKSGYGLTLEDEIKILRVIKSLRSKTPLEIVSTFLGAHEIPDEYSDNPVAYHRIIIEEMLPRVAAEELAEYADVFCELGYFNVQRAREVLEAARQWGLKLRIHCEQFRRFGGAQLAAQLKARSADHLDWANEEDFDALRESRTIPVLLPAAIYHLGLDRYPPMRQMIEADLPVALASDFNPGSAPTLNMQMVLSIACTQMRVVPAEAIVAATINAAHSIDRGDRVGSIEEGKQADFVVYDCQDYREIPYLFGVNHALTVVKNGRVVYSLAR